MLDTCVRFNFKLVIEWTGGCQAAWDDLLCWPPASPGQIVSISCSKVLQIMEVPLSDTTKEKLTSGKESTFTPSSLTREPI